VVAFTAYRSGGRGISTDHVSYSNVFGSGESRSRGKQNGIRYVSNTKYLEVGQAGVDEIIGIMVLGKT
jgi:hypothetical protein